MKIEADRDGGSAVLRLGGRLDREASEHLSNTLEDLLRDGVRSLTLDLSGVTYVSSAATKMITRWQQELAVLRGVVHLTSLPPVVRETFAITGWEEGRDAPAGGQRIDLRQSSWQNSVGFAASGQYQVSSSVSDAVLSCRLHGHPDQLTRAPFGPDDCEVVAFPENVFGLGLGAIGATFDSCRDRLGELVAMAGCIAHFPTDGARMADYLVGEGPLPPRALLASGLSCQGAFSKLVRFSPKAEAESVLLSEVAAMCLEAAGNKLAGMVIVAESAGLSGARLRRSPAAPGSSPLPFEVPAVREWLSFAPERTHPKNTAIIVGVAARKREGPLAPYLRPLGGTGRLYGHFHAAVFSYHPLPQRTVELAALLKGFFQNYQLRDVLHLLSDDRGELGVGESALLRGVGWIAPIAQVS